MNECLGRITNPGVPLMMTLCLEEDSILISNAVLDALEAPRQIQMLINEQQKRLLLQACSTQEREAVVVMPQYYMQFEMSGHALLKKIRKLTGWTDNAPRLIEGTLIPPLRAVMFDLSDAKPAVLYTPGTDFQQFGFERNGNSNAPNIK